VEACPYLNGKELCCSPAQDEQMKKNFQAIDATFGSAGGGCDVFVPDSSFHSWPQMR
jgi:hypothetical protein